MTELNSLAGKISQTSNALRTLGIDIDALQKTAAAFQMIGGTGEIIKGIISAKQAYATAKAAWGTANIAKWGPGAFAVGAAAVAGGVAMGALIERYARVDDSDAGLRLISGGGAYGRA